MNEQIKTAIKTLAAQITSRTDVITALQLAQAIEALANSMDTIAHNFGKDA